jgi:hypothetical protein
MPDTSGLMAQARGGGEKQPKHDVNSCEWGEESPMSE